MNADEKNAIIENVIKMLLLEDDIESEDAGVIWRIAEKYGYTQREELIKRSFVQKDKDLLWLSIDDSDRVFAISTSGCLSMVDLYIYIPKRTPYYTPYSIDDFNYAIIRMFDSYEEAYNFLKKNDLLSYSEKILIDKGSEFRQTK